MRYASPASKGVYFHGEAVRYPVEKFELELRGDYADPPYHPVMSWRPIVVALAVLLLGLGVWGWL
jgi:hypothetical protein